MLGGGRRTLALALSVALAPGLVVWTGVAGLTAAPQQNLPTKAPVTDPKDASPWPDAAALAAAKRAADSRPLFAAAEPLVFTLVADFGQVQKDREPDSTRSYPAKLIVAQSSQSETSIPVQIRTRGHSRLKPDFCTFAPLRIEFAVNPVGTVFEGQRKLKLGTHCRDQGEYSEYVVREYPVYRMFNALTPRSFRARLAEAHYVDAKSLKPIAVRTALFLEDDDDVARRLEGRISDTTGIRFGQLDSAMTTMTMLFEYMIGNTDLSIKSLHNIRVVLTPGGTRYPIPYDFDFSGVVNAQYAAPNPLVSLSSVRERIYLGPCQTPAVFEVFLARFRKAQAEMMGVYDSVPALKPKSVSAAKSYLEEFFRTIERPPAIKKAFVDGCNGRHSI